MTEQQKAAMRMALECFEWHIEAGAYGHDIEGTAGLLRALLAEPEPVASDNLPPMPDPVAWQVIDRLGKERNAPLFAEWQMRSYARVAVDLTAQPTRRPLTPVQEAAPELLDALHAMLSHTAMLDPSQGFDGFDHAAVNQARAAIAKATGGNDE